MNVFNDWTYCYVLDAQFATKNRFYQSLNEKQIEKQIENEKVYSIQLNIAIMIYCTVLLLCVVQSKKRIRIWKNWKFQNKVAKANHFHTTNLHTWFQSFVHIDIFSDKRQSFQISIIHSSIDKSKMSKRLKKFAQFVEMFIQNEFILFRSRETIWKQRFRSFYSLWRTSKVKISRTFSKINRMLISTKA